MYFYAGLPEAVALGSQRLGAPVALAAAPTHPSAGSGCAAAPSHLPLVAVAFAGGLQLWDVSSSRLLAELRLPTRTTTATPPPTPAASLSGPQSVPHTGGEVGGVLWRADGRALVLTTGRRLLFVTLSFGEAPSGPSGEGDTTVGSASTSSHNHNSHTHGSATRTRGSVSGRTGRTGLTGGGFDPAVRSRWWRDAAQAGTAEKKGTGSNAAAASGDVAAQLRLVVLGEGVAVPHGVLAVVDGGGHVLVATGAGVIERVPWLSGHVEPTPALVLSR